jgi:site-specific DNA recombinase
MKATVLYARVSSKEQEQGFSLESQERTGRAYAKSKGFEIVREFSYSESAKKQGRKHFNAMVEYLRANPAVRIVLVEKTDRLSRNLKDYVMLESLVEELELEIHLIKEGQVLQTGSKSQDKLVQGMFALLARNYIQNLQEEVQKGQTVKAEKGQYPGRAPFGYAHDRQTRTIVAHPNRAGVVRLLFELHSTGWYTVMTLRKAIIEKTGERISKSYLHKILTSRFYLGKFTWRGREYQGIHPPLIDCVTFESVQQIISGRSKRKAQKHKFAFSGLMTCAEDNCAITAELHKGKYTYYRCTFGRGRHSFPYMREQATANMLSMVLAEIDVPLKLARAIAHLSRHDTAANEPSGVRK